MKNLSPSIVMVEDIKPNKPRESFNKNNINKLANLILEIEGLINPIILKREKLNLKTYNHTYSIIKGHLEYWSAIRAEEINPIKGETINSYIIDSDEEEKIYKQQIKLLRK